jgi:hypothetical protein
MDGEDNQQQPNDLNDQQLQDPDLEGQMEGDELGQGQYPVGQDPN